MRIQNHDIQAKTNAEMVKIFKWLDGANDIEIGEMSETINLRISYYRQKFNWTFSTLNLLKKGLSQNKKLVIIYF